MPTGVIHFLALYQTSKFHMDPNSLNPAIGGYILLMLLKTPGNALDPPGPTWTHLDPTGPGISKSVIIILLPSVLSFLLFCNLI